MIIHKEGNIFDSEADIIGHGTNTEGVMGSGIAVQFRDKFPTMHRDYVRLCRNIPNERLVGTAVLWGNYDGEGSEWGRYPLAYVANIFSQDLPGPHAKYEWAIKGINQVINFAIQNDLGTIALPQIGCGVGGLNWDTMLEHLDEHFADAPLVIELWTYKPTE